MKKATILLFLLTIVAGMHAKSSAIIVWLTSGDKITYSLSERPKVATQDEKTIFSTTETDIVYDAGDIRMITFVETDNIGETAGDFISPLIRYAGDRITLMYFNPNETVYLYDFDGRVIDRCQTDGKGSLSIASDKLNRGSYIIKTKHQSYKFIKK